MVSIARRLGTDSGRNPLSSSLRTLLVEGAIRSIPVSTIAHAASTTAQ
jgi:hypothetical protein